MRIRVIYRVLIWGLFLQTFFAHAVTYLFSHGFADSYRQAYQFTKYYSFLGIIRRNKYYIIDGPLKTFDYPDAIIKPFIKLYRTSLGQTNEIEALKKSCDALDDDVVLIGVSRGAAVALNLLGTYSMPNVKALVVEAPFDELKNVFDYCWYTRLIATVLRVSTEKLYDWFSKISAYDPKGPRPIDMVSRIKKDLPILIICSEDDDTIRGNSSVKLYKKLCETGHEHAYLLQFKHGPHARLIRSKEGEAYQNVVHAFYEKYELPHNSEFAQKGRLLFEKCLPIP